MTGGFYVHLQNGPAEMTRIVREGLSKMSEQDIDAKLSRQPIERGRLHYLDFIPATLESVQRCLRELPDFADLGTVFPLDFSLDDARRRVKRWLDGSAQDHASAG